MATWSSKKKGENRNFLNNVVGWEKKQTPVMDSACLMTSDGSGTTLPEIQVLKVCRGEMGLWQVEHGFSSFFAKYLPYLMIFQS